jgi:hypothetical protein
MATALDIVTRALRSLRVLASGDTPSADEAADGLTALNDMLFAWRIDGIDLGHVALASSDTLDVPDDHLFTIRLSLAERLAGEYGAALSPDDLRAAELGRAALRAQYFSIQDLTSDNPLSSRNLANDW